MKSSHGLPLVFALLSATFASCSDSGPGTPPQKTLGDFLPPLPTPDGTPQSVYAGAITTANAAKELIPGPATSGLAGDFFIRNAKARFVIQSTTRAIGVIPWGGNVVDAVPLKADGTDDGVDQLGEVSMIYVLGRTCAHDHIEVLLDGSGGGPAVIRATGHAAANDYVNLRGIGLFNVPADLDPDIEDHVDCATTYTLAPDANTLQIAWTLYNGGDYDVNGPFGALNDTGGNVESFSPEIIGFNRAAIDALLTNSDPQPAPYAVYQAPGVAYGIVPVHGPEVHNATFLVAGVSIMIYGADQLLDILDSAKFYLHLKKNDGLTNQLNLVVGHDGADVETTYEAQIAKPTTVVSGTVSYMPSAAPGAMARVGVFRDKNGDGMLDAQDFVETYTDVKPEGTWSLSLVPGTYFIRADVKDVARSTPETITVAAAPVTAPLLALPDPAHIDYTIVDDATGQPIPAKLQVIGRHPAAPDFRTQETYDRRPGIVRVIHAINGTSTPPAPTDPADPTLEVPAGGPYRIWATRGPEYSVDSFVVSPTAGQALTHTFHLRRVVDTTGYVAGEFHEHSLGSPDSPVRFEDRLSSLVVEGIEFFASTDHDFLTDYDPMIDDLGLRPWIDSVVGVEATPFAFGHFIAYPLTADLNDPTHGAVDWAYGAGPGSAMLPGDLWNAYRAKGASVIQVNHPRALSAFTGFQAYFDRAGLSFDFTARTFTGDVNEQPVPADWLRLPDASKVFDPTFDTLEVWNGFATGDTDMDGVPEITILDVVMRDWMNLMSFGKVVTPMGNSDSHTREKDAAGMPRTLIRVPDDSSAAIMAGEDDDIYATVLGNGKPRDVVVTDGPMLAVSADGGATSAIGATVTPDALGNVTLTIHASSADWVDFDTIEIFANTTFDTVDKIHTALPPIACFTSRDPATMMATDPCLLAPDGGAQPMTVQLTNVPGPGTVKVRGADVTFTVKASDIPKHTGAQGNDAWLVVRVRGQKAIYPVMVEAAIDDTNLDTLVSGTDVEIDAALRDKGVPAEAFTGPILVDFDGAGWKAPFAP